MKKIKLIICFILVAFAVSAQCPLSFHAKVGIGTSRFYGKHSAGETLIAYKVGAGAEYALNQTWVLQSALEFVSIGGTDEIETVGKANMNELYLQIPVMIAARLHLGKDYHVSLGMGPYIAYGVGGKTSGETDSNSNNSGYLPDNCFKIATFGSMKKGKMGNIRFDTGIALNLSLEYHKFIVGAEVQVGLVTVNQQINQLISFYENRGSYLPKNFASFFTVGYRF